MRSFFITGSSSTISEKRYYGSWNRLLNTMFPVDTASEVVPQLPATTAHEAVDFIFLLLVYINETPVFVVEIKPLDHLRRNSKRQEADLQLRRPFYTYDKNTRRILPRAVTPDPDILVDTAPKEWWSYDIVEEDGANKFREVVKEVEEMCKVLSLVDNKDNPDAFSITIANPTRPPTTTIATTATATTGTCRSVAFWPEIAS
ncbi:hypothetical protein BDP27DRAFT_1421169 [Rhodocollybia butyracea]|uniref:Uncharacterized protein n=1 Tax=Rhodocollybia butyracea TaxID=206335 RepID=A0A9P5U7P0_9AGAR|nr:hypothetical protein BDP27DRAFT_1421169 [Rhodocollybia butyracea]